MFARCRSPFLLHLRKAASPARGYGALALPQPALVEFPSFGPALQRALQSALAPLRESTTNLLESILNGVLNIKRTFQPSLIKRKRTHGFLARQATRHGIDIINRRRRKGRKRLTA